MKFRLSETGSPADLDTLVDTRLLVQANSGGGKSWCIRRLLEQTHGHVQHLVIDPEGEFSSLREKYDYVLAARHAGDTGVDPRAARLLAERLLELGVSAILDIYELKAHERIRFVRQFLEALVDAPKKLWHPAIVVVDEAHVFCPQAGEAESAGAVIDLATRGRKRGFCAVLATQRLSKLHKDAAAECNNKLIGRTGLDVDVKRAADELGLTKERWRELRDLAPGEFFAFGPALSREVVKLKTGPVETRHPKAGARLAAVVPPATAKIRALLPKLADLPAEVEQKAKTEAELRAELNETKRLLRETNRALDGTKGAAPAPERIQVETIPGWVFERVGGLRVVAAHLRRSLDKVEIKVDGEDQLALMRGRSGEILDATEQLADLLATIQKQHAPGPPARVTGSAGVSRVPKTPASFRGGDAHALSPEGEGRRPQSDNVGPGASISATEQKVLNAIAWYEALGVEKPTKQQVGLVAGYKVGKSAGGHYGNTLGALRTKRFLDYPEAGHVRFTDEGRRLAQDPGLPGTPKALQEHVLGLLSETEQKVLKAILTEYPNSTPRADVAQQTGYKPEAASGGHFANTLGRLRTLGLVTYPTGGFVKAAPVLFLDGA